MGNPSYTFQTLTNKDANPLRADNQAGTVSQDKPTLISKLLTPEANTMLSHPQRPDQILAQVFLWGVRLVDCLVPLNIDLIRKRLEEIVPYKRSKKSDQEIDDAVERETGTLLDAVRKSSAKYTESGKLSLEMAKWAFERDDERTTTLDTKGEELSNQAATSLAVVFTLGGWLLINQQKELHWTWWMLSAFYVFTLFLMMQAVWYAGKALHVRGGWRGLNQADLFHVKELVNPEREVFLADAVWKLYRANTKVNDRKARALKVGQSRFTWAMIILLLMGILVVGARIGK